MMMEGGKLYFEINSAYGPETLAAAVHSGLKNARLLRDMNNKNRILRGNI
jgi:release factor glutamine methyltransferase